MLRSEIETLMKQKGQSTIALVLNKTDQHGVYCCLKGGYLVDYTGHRVDRKKDIWGKITWHEGKPRRVSFAAEGGQ